MTRDFELEIDQDFLEGLQHVVGEDGTEQYRIEII